MTQEAGSKPPCPLCGSQDSRTLKTLWVEAKHRTWRRRECLACQARFSTSESIIQDEPAVRVTPGKMAKE